MTAFVSRLGPAMSDFLDYKHALGNKYTTASVYLRELDRYNAAHGDHHTLVKEIVDGWGADLVNKGYDIFSFDGMGIYEISRIDDVNAFATDDDAVKQAIKDGIKIIPVEELPETFGRRYLGWIDTPENRARIAELAEKYPNDRLV